MEMKKPKPKKFASCEKNFILPSQNEKKHVGVFNGQNVTVSDWNSMYCLYYWGNFGKGTLSKAAPMYHIKQSDIPRVISEQQFENQSKWNVNIHYSSPEKYTGFLKNNKELSVTSVNDFLQFTFNDNRQECWKTWKKKHKKEFLGNRSEIKSTTLLEFSSDNSEYVDIPFSDMVTGILKSKRGKMCKMCEIKNEEEVIVVNSYAEPNTASTSGVNLNARIEKMPYIAEENLNLGLEESFFLNFAAGCLKIVDINQVELSTTELWEKFREAQKNFLEKYVIYHYYRTKGWIVKSGLKFGGDFILYKDGPAYYHASYIIQVLNNQKSLTWREFVGMNRLVETFNKDLILCEVVSKNSSSEKDDFPECLKYYTVREVMARRWFPAKDRVSKEDKTS